MRNSLQSRFEVGFVGSVYGALQNYGSATTKLLLVDAALRRFGTDYLVGVFRMGLYRLYGAAVVCGLSSLVGLASNASAEVMRVTVTVRNLAPTNSVSFAPLRLGFGNGTFDAFNIGQSANAAITSIAEGGSGSAWFPAFTAAEPNAVLGSVGGALTPGTTASSFFDIDTASANNRFFTFATMVLPSNDLFLGNDNPAAFQLFNANGTLAISTINQTAGQIWDNNSEIADPANAAFVVGGVNSQRTPENGLIAFDRTELNVFNGLTTGAGYVFNSTLLPTDATQVYQIGFSITAVPEPSSMMLGAMAFGGIGLVTARKRWKKPSEQNAKA
jgi:hypothetical protein